MSSESYIAKNGDTYETMYNTATDAQKAKLPSPKPATLGEAWEIIKNWTVNELDQNDNAKKVTEGVSIRKAMEEYINCYFLGEPYKQAAYQSFVELYLNFGQEPDKAENYTRSLDLNSAVATVEYDYNDTHYTRENFVSYDKQAVVTRLTAVGADKLNVEAELHTWQHSATFEKIADNQIAIRGSGKKSDLCYEARLIIDTDGQLEVKNASEKSPTSSTTSGTETTYTYFPMTPLMRLQCPMRLTQTAMLWGQQAIQATERACMLKRTILKRPNPAATSMCSGLGTNPRR